MKTLKDKVKLFTRKQSMLADVFTPVGAYLKLRDRFACVQLLESSDYHGEENSISYICCDIMASFWTHQTSIYTQSEGSAPEKIEGLKPLEALRQFKESFDYTPQQTKPIETGLFGYISFDALSYFEDLELQQPFDESSNYPEIRYDLYRFVVAFDHFQNLCHVIETYTHEPKDDIFNEVCELISRPDVPSFGFSRDTSTKSDQTDAEFLENVKTAMHHCDIGDVFQLVLSRRFQVGFKGDEFQVYRALRSINPSPYLFYFDYGRYKLFGSSPEAQIVINEKTASIFPIAGTFRRTGDDAADAELANKLLEDPKENAEHIMLVDLARNDLSKHTHHVRVETYREIQYYSHVIHLVSKVTGDMSFESDPLSIVADTFPAGTLSGAPKYRALQLIDKLERSRRGFYAGAIGFMDFGKKFNHAIMIRTFLSQDNMITYRAGAGIVSRSTPENEVQEVYNKLAALEKALETATKRHEHH